MPPVSDRYSWLAIALHWLIAIAIFGLFALGLWMVGLDYYSPWYQKGPNLHRSIGVLVLLALGLRLAWRWLVPPPSPLPSLSWLEVKVSHLMHWALYGVLLLVLLSGYLISTATGDPVSVFGWFEVPATITKLPGQADLAGDLHLFLALTLVALALLHALAALKHHFIDRDRTLLRMLGRSGKP